MIRLKVFVSSVQKEMESERQAIRDYLRDDALLRRFFDVFLFEDLPAADRGPTPFICKRLALLTFIWPCWK